MKVILLALSFVLSSCASHKISNADYQSEPSYQSRPELSSNFLAKSPGNLSDQEIHKLLNSKVGVRDTVKLAILKLEHTGSNYWYASNNYHMQEAADEITQTQFETLLKKSGKIKAVAFIPSFLMPKERSLANLRDSAALVQADFLLILKTKSRSNFDLNILKDNEALSIATIEAALMDVSTGVVPYTGLVTGKVKATMSKDFNKEEFLIRSRSEAEGEAYKSLMTDIEKVFR